MKSYNVKLTKDDMRFIKNSLVILYIEENDMHDFDDECKISKRIFKKFEQAEKPQKPIAIDHSDAMNIINAKVGLISKKVR